MGIKLIPSLLPFYPQDQTIKPISLKQHGLKVKKYNYSVYLIFTSINE